MHTGQYSEILQWQIILITQLYELKKGLLKLKQLRWIQHARRQVEHLFMVNAMYVVQGMTYLLDQYQILIAGLQVQKVPWDQDLAKQLVQLLIQIVSVVLARATEGFSWIGWGRFEVKVLLCLADKLLGKVETITCDIIAQLVVQDGCLGKVALEEDGDQVEGWPFLFRRWYLSCPLWRQDQFRWNWLSD